MLNEVTAQENKQSIFDKKVYFSMIHLNEIYLPDAFDRNYEEDEQNKYQ